MCAIRPPERVSAIMWHSDDSERDHPSPHQKWSTARGTVRPRAAARGTIARLVMGPECMIIGGCSTLSTMMSLAAQLLPCHGTEAAYVHMDVNKRDGMKVGRGQPQKKVTGKGNIHICKGYQQGDVLLGTLLCLLLTLEQY
jgi:hypothetical protein